MQMVQTLVVIAKCKNIVNKCAIPQHTGRSYLAIHAYAPLQRPLS